MPFETPHDGSGTVLSFNGTTYTVTNVVVSATDPTADEDKISVSHLGQTAGETAKTLELPLAGAASGETGRSVTFDYIADARHAGRHPRPGDDQARAVSLTEDRHGYLCVWRHGYVERRGVQRSLRVARDPRRCVAIGSRQYVDA